ncbi:MAG: hypothetical protein ACFCD0_29565 [Gemmataceae bacterium]
MRASCWHYVIIVVDPVLSSQAARMASWTEPVARTGFTPEGFLAERQAHRRLARMATY